MNELLASVRRRLRVAWAVATADIVVPVALAVAAGLVVLARFRPWIWPEPVAWLLLASVLVTIGGTALVLRVPMIVAARAADRGLATDDAFATALEVGEHPFAGRVHARAASLAAGRRGTDAVPLPIRPRRVAVSALLALAVAAFVVVPNPQDGVRARAAAADEALDAEADAVEEAAVALRTDAGPTAEAAAARLEALAEELRQAEGLEEGQAALDRAAAELAAGIEPGFLAQKAAVVGLGRSLEAAPLSAGGTGSAADQLAAAAAGLAELSEAELAALAERLAALAATQAAGNPGLAESLQAAAAALGSGDVSGAAAALGEGAGQQAFAATAVGAQEAATAAIGTVSSASGHLASGAPPQQGRGQGQGQGSGQGQGQGSGQGQGQGSGQGSGQGPGQGQGSGSGQGGQGQGGGQGQVGGTGAPTGSGRGGKGTANGSGDNASVGLQEGATVFDPDDGSTDGDQLIAEGDAADGRNETVGKGDGATRRGGRIVPLADAFPTYDAEATTALDQLQVPPSVRALVRAYFDGLGGRR